MINQIDGSCAIHFPGHLQEMHKETERVRMLECHESTGTDGLAVLFTGTPSRLILFQVYW